LKERRELEEQLPPRVVRHGERPVDALAVVDPGAGEREETGTDEEIVDLFEAPARESVELKNQCVYPIQDEERLLRTLLIVLAALKVLHVSATPANFDVSIFQNSYLELACVGKLLIVSRAAASFRPAMMTWAFPLVYRANA
jgi:hypothetical protein